MIEYREAFFEKDELGASLLEYALILTLVSIISIPAIIAFSEQLGPLFCKVINGLNKEELEEREWNGYCCIEVRYNLINEQCLNSGIDWDAIGIPSPCLEPKDLEGGQSLNFEFEEKKTKS